jgi:hypothetical protein
MNDFRPNPSQPHTQLAVETSAQTLLELGLSVHPNTAFMQIYVEGSDVRVTVNGDEPTSEIGIRWNAGSLWEIGYSEALALKVVGVNGPATLQVAAFKQ